MYKKRIIKSILLVYFILLSILAVGYKFQNPKENIIGSILKNKNIQIDNTTYSIIPNDSTKATQNLNAINTALASYANQGITDVTFVTGTYYLDCGHSTMTNMSGYSIDVPANMTIDLNGSTFIQIGTNQPAYTMFKIGAVSNVTVKNGTLIGDTLTHDYTTISSTHEFGFGIRIYDSNNITISDMDIYNMTGDSIIIDGKGDYVGNTGSVAENINIINNRLHDNRRQGISVTGGKNILIQGNYIYNIGQFMGTSPMTGIDLESEKGWPIENTTITGNTFYGNVNSAVAVVKGVDTSGNVSGTIITNNNVSGSISLGFGSGTQIMSNTITNGGIYSKDTNIPIDTLIDGNNLTNAEIIVNNSASVTIGNNSLIDGSITVNNFSGHIYNNTINNTSNLSYGIWLDNRATTPPVSTNPEVYFYNNVVNGTFVNGATILHSSTIPNPPPNWENSSSSLTTSNSSTIEKNPISPNFHPNYISNGNSSGVSPYIYEEFDSYEINNNADIISQHSYETNTTSNDIKNDSTYSGESKNEYSGIKNPTTGKVYSNYLLLVIAIVSLIFINLRFEYKIKLKKDK